tara:strand:- start:7019 stop:8026 length:1008 start_codon:yes stop_codon:yes gene_type:complete
MEYYIADARRQLREIERKRLEKEQNRSENWQRSASVAYKLGDAYVKGQNVKASEMMQDDPSLKYSDKYMDDSWWNKIKRPFTKAENRFVNTETPTEVPEIDMTKVGKLSPTDAVTTVENTDVPSQYGDIYDNSQWEATQQGVNKISDINKTIYDKNTNLIADATEEKTYNLIKPMLENQKDQFLREGGDIYYKGMLDNPHLRDQSVIDDMWASGQGEIGVDGNMPSFTRNQINNFVTPPSSPSAGFELHSHSEMEAMDKMQGSGGALGKVAGGLGVAKSAYDLYKNRDGKFDTNDAIGLAQAGLGVAGLMGVGATGGASLALTGGKMLYDWWEDR